MVKRTDWNNYFYTHYKPEKSDWGINDLEKYKLWYKPWIRYIESNFSFTFSGKKALELGCGIGSICSLLHEKGMNIIGSDIASTMVDAAKRVQQKLDFVVYDVMEPFPKKEKFDYVFAFEVLEHIPKLDKALENISSLLVKDGWFIGTSPYPYPKNMIDKTHVNVHTPSEWKNFFLDTKKFKHISTRPLSFLPLLWRIPPYINPVIPIYLAAPGCISTTLILAQKA